MAPTPRGPDAPPTPLLALQLWQGRPQLLLEGRGGPLKVELNTPLHNGHWHTIHIQLHSKVRTATVAYCHCYLCFRVFLLSLCLFWFSFVFCFCYFHNFKVTKNDSQEIWSIHS